MLSVNSLTLIRKKSSGKLVTTERREKVNFLLIKLRLNLILKNKNTMNFKKLLMNYKELKEKKNKIEKSRKNIDSLKKKKTL